MAKILVCDDDIGIATSVKMWLQGEQHKVDVVHNPLEALDYLRSFDYDLLLLDWNMPEMTGVELCKKYRASGGSGFVLLFTILSATDSKVQGLEAGADDYMTKPFEMKELLARINALLRRPTGYRGTVLKSGDILLDTRSRIVTKSGAEIHLKPMEFSVLQFFMQHPNEVIPFDTLLRRLWDSGPDSSVDAVYTCVNRVRRKLGESDNQEIITTVHGVGYRFNL